MPLIFVAVLGVYQVLLFFVHAAVYKTIVDAFGLTGPWLAWVFVLLTLTFLAASLAAHRFSNFFIKWWYRASAYWFGLVHFLFIGAFIFDIFSTVIYHYNHYTSPALLGTICLGIPFIAHLFATRNAGKPQWTRVDLSLPNVPAHWKGKKIVFVSDFHLGNIWSARFCATVIDMIKAEAPEAVFVGGDIFDGVKCHSESLIKPFTGLRPPLGIFFVSGNHEYIEDTLEIFEEVERDGMRILRNETVDLKGIALTGLDWKDTYRRENFEKVLAKISLDPKKTNILMRHEPSHLDLIEEKGFALNLSGHTHNGQIWPLSLIAKRVYRGFHYGLKQMGGLMNYTSSGVGTWGPPMRFKTKSEVVAITFK